MRSGDDQIMDRHPSTLLVPGRPLLSPVLRPLPYEVVPLDEEALREVDRFFEQWQSTFGFSTESFTTAARGYLKYCCPEGATLDQILVAAEFLAWCFCLNDLEDAAYRRQVVDDALEVLGGERRASKPEVRATRALLMSLENRAAPVPIARFRWRMQQMLESFRWEAEQEKGQPSAPLETFLGHREQLIVHLCYAEMWRVLLRAEVPPDPARGMLEVVESHSSRIVFAANDIMSVPRDLRLKKLNLVLWLRNENASSLESAVDDAVTFLAQELAAYGLARAQIERVVTRSHPLHRYLAFLDAVLEGNRLGTVALVDRYWVDDHPIVNSDESRCRKPQGDSV